MNDSLVFFLYDWYDYLDQGNAFKNNDVNDMPFEEFYNRLHLSIARVFRVRD